MDSFELNKIIGAILGTLLFVMGVGIVAESVYKPLEDRGPGYALPEPVAAADAGAPAKAEVPLAVLLASADATKGQADTRKCASCHNFAKGEGNKTGPLLYGVVGRMPATHEGFQYSDGMTEHKTKGEVWTYERLNSFLTSPKTYTPGTKMNFPGVKDPAERADILAYLQTLSDAPVPFPAPDAAPAAAAPAADAATTPSTDAAAPAAAPATDAAATPAAPAAAPAAGATAPAAAPAVQTPTTTDSQTPVEGTPVTTTN